MAPKKKGGAKAETPEQLAARRAAAMAMFNTSSTPKDGKAPTASKPAPPKPAPAAEVAAPAAEQPDVSDAPKAAQGGDVFTDGGEDVRKGAVEYAASTFGKGGEHLAVALPADGAGWVKILLVEPTPAMVKNAKKTGEVQVVQNECKIYNLKDVACTRHAPTSHARGSAQRAAACSARPRARRARRTFGLRRPPLTPCGVARCAWVRRATDLYDADGRSNVACWRTKLEGANLGTGEQPSLRSAGTKLKALMGKEGKMLAALQTHTGASIVALPSGHVMVRAGEEATCDAVKLIDNMLDADGALVCRHGPTC
jgi:hypothetical protein